MSESELRNKKAVRILWLWDDLDKIGGVQILLLNLAKKINRYKYEIVIAVNNYGEIASEFEKLGIKVIKLKRKPRYDCVSFLKLYKLVKRLKVDMIHTHGYYFGLRGRIVGKICRKPTICTYHANFRKEASSARIRLTTKITLCLANYVNFVSLEAESSFHNTKPIIFSKDILFYRKYFTIYNGVDIKKIESRISNINKEEIREKLKLKKSDKVIVNVGRLSIEKGHKYLIKAMKLVVKKMPETKLLIVGDGELKEELIKICISLGIEKNVFFLGERRDVIEILAVADIFVYQSLWGSLGLAVFEAIASGVPVVIPETTGVYELIRCGENGLIHIPTNPDSIYRCIERLLKDKKCSREIALQALEDIHDKYSIDNTAKSYFAIYAHLTQNTI